MRMVDLVQAPLGSHGDEPHIAASQLKEVTSMAGGRSKPGQGF